MSINLETQIAEVKVVVAIRWSLLQKRQAEMEPLKLRVLEAQERWAEAHNELDRLQKKLQEATE